MTLEKICVIPVMRVLPFAVYLYLWVPNALLADGLEIMRCWGFTYKTNLSGTRLARMEDPMAEASVSISATLPNSFFRRSWFDAHAATQTNVLISQKRERSRKPDQIYDIVESCSPGPYLELFARFRRSGWDQWGNEDVEENSLNDIARRKGHVEPYADPQIRLLEVPPQYREPS